ncbi:MAG: glycogen debranching enzyme GlgX, partial [Nitrospinota bacterium]
GFDPHGRFFATVRQDPVLSRLKLIAEPWDLGEGGYQLGNFPGGWAEWNGRYRDAVRRFWRGDPGQVSELASRLSGSSDLYGPGGRGPADRRPQASVNFVTCHDGFTLRDLVSYEAKHNEANAEDGRDGTDDNWSRNWGAEGPTDSPAVLRTRGRMMRNFLATLAFSQGVPMLSHGDEVGRTQRGNNNAYCQDNEITWVDWALDAWQNDLLSFTARVFAIRRKHPALRRRRFFRGHPVNEDGDKDLAWIRPDGAEMTEQDWADPENGLLGMLINGEAADEVDERGRPVGGDVLLLLVNAGGRSRDFTLPAMRAPGRWKEVVHTARPGTRTVKGGEVHIGAQSLVLLAYGSP